MAELADTNSHADTLAALPVFFKTDWSLCSVFPWATQMSLFACVAGQADKLVAVLPDLQYAIKETRNGEIIVLDSKTFTVPRLQDVWATGSHCATVVFADCDELDKIYGRLFIRQV